MIEIKEEMVEPTSLKEVVRFFNHNFSQFSGGIIHLQEGLIELSEATKKNDKALAAFFSDKLNNITEQINVLSGHIIELEKRIQGLEEKNDV